MSGCNVWGPLVFDVRLFTRSLRKKRILKKTAFVCREGQFKFKTMPFGLCNAGATFKQLMDMVMSGLAFEVYLVYRDDVIVFSAVVEGSTSPEDLTPVMAGRDDVSDEVTHGPNELM